MCLFIFSIVRVIVGVYVFFVCVFGSGIAWRQVWIQQWSLWRPLVAGNIDNIAADMGHGKGTVYGVDMNPTNSIDQILATAFQN